MKTSGTELVTRLALDTSAYSQFRHGHEIVLDYLASAEMVLLPVTVLGEFHYNGLGVRDIASSTLQIASPDFRQRLLRGDMQILSQQALALQVSTPLGLTLSTGLLVLQSPTDGSGLLAPSLVWDIGDTGRILTSVYFPWGDEPMAGQLQSEYGGTPLSLFVQGAWYR